MNWFDQPEVKMSPEGIPVAEFWRGLPGRMPGPHVRLGGCLIETDGEGNVLGPNPHINGKKVAEGYNEETGENWVDVRNYDGDVWRVTWKTPA